MIYREALDGVAAELRKQAAAVVIPAADGTPPPPTWAAADTKTPYWRATHARGRLTSLAATVDDLCSSIAATQQEPHHETLITALRGAAALQQLAADNGALPQAERGQRRSRAATLAEIVSAVEAFIRSYQYGRGGRPRTYRLMGAEYPAACLWRAVAEGFRQEAEGGADPQRVGSRLTLYQRTREEYYYLRSLVPALPDLRDAVPAEVATQAPAPSRDLAELRSPAQEAAQSLQAAIGLGPTAAAPSPPQPAPTTAVRPAVAPARLTGTAAELAAAQARVAVETLPAHRLAQIGGRPALRGLSTGMPLPPPIRAALEEEAVVPQDVLLVRQGGREHLLWHPQGQEWPGVAGWTWADGARPEILAQLGPGRGALLEID